MPLNKEVEGFKRLGHKASILGCYGSYTERNTYNILLEFADRGSLENYFQKESPPSDREDIVKFWKALFELIDALRTIHESSNADCEPQIFHGYATCSSRSMQADVFRWHQNIKPANILVMSKGKSSPYDWQFKLADIGLDHFENNGSEADNASASEDGGTRVYGKFWETISHDLCI
jgi:serine/threonine protein kinase